MRSTTLLTLVVAFLSSLAFSAQQEREIVVFAWPLSASKAQTLAKISYTSTNATVQSFTAPKIPPGDDVIRIGFHHSSNSGKWSGVATAASNFAPGLGRKVLLHLNAEGVVYHVGFKATEQGSSAKGGKDGLDVEVVRMRKGPTPHLNKPVVVSADGKVEDKEPEKSFLQKYWWVIGGFLLLQVVLGGGGKE